MFIYQGPSSIIDFCGLDMIFETLSSGACVFLFLRGVLAFFRHVLSTVVYFLYMQGRCFGTSLF